MGGSDGLWEPHRKKAQDRLLIGREGLREPQRGFAGFQRPRRTDRWKDGEMEGQTDGFMDGWTYE